MDWFIVLYVVATYHFSGIIWSDWLVWLFGFYGVSTFVGYLTSNSVYMYIPFTNIYLVGKIFYKQYLIFLHMINQF